jgi:CRP-like cAMP-binding protein
MFEKIDDYVARCVNLTTEETKTFHDVLHLKKFKKKSILLHKGQVCDFEGFVVKGCLKVYYLDEHGHEVILLFAVENWWIGDIAGITEGSPSNTFIETMEDCEIIMIYKEDKEALYSRIPKLERMFRLMIQRAYVVLQNRFFATLSQPAEERYLDFLKRYPNIPQRVPQHQIAAYLGISPEFLSKIRAKLATEGK